MCQAVAKIGRKKASALARSIAKGTVIPELEHDHYRHEDLEVPGLDEPNQPQIRALRMALSNRFSLIQGPPGIFRSSSATCKQHFSISPRLSDSVQ